MRLNREETMDANKVAGLLDDVSQGRISRRDFLRVAMGLGVSMPAAAALLQGCAPAAAPEPTAAPAATAAPGATAAPTSAPPAAPAKTTLVVGQPKAPINMNPVAMGTWDDMPLLTSVMDSLFDPDYEKGELIPVLVDEWEQTDPVTWNFKLKEGVQFHKGYGEFTAEDYAFWVNKVVTEQTAAYFTMGSGKVAEAIATDKYGLEIRLTEPWAAFWVMTLITYGGVVFSKKAYEEMGGEAFGLNPIGTGPFELESWTPGGDVVLKRFEDYHDPNLPHLDEIRFTGVEDPLVRLEKMRAGELDYTVGLDSKDVPDMEADPNLNVVWGPGHNWDVIRFNHADTDEPWGDVRVRKAIAHAIDRQQIVDVIYYGGATPEDDPLPAGYIGAEPDHKFWPDTADLDTAKALLADAGYADGFKMPVMTDERPNQRAEAQLLADQLSKVGIEMEIEVVDRATSTSRLNNTEFHTNVGTAGMASADSDSAISIWYHSDSVSSHNYYNERVNELSDKAAASLDKDERARLYREAVDIIIGEDCADAIICNVARMYVLAKGLAGFIAYPLHLFPYFKNMYWEQ
jgi:peptide/nickel transport system substrate-binding protein